MDDRIGAFVVVETLRKVQAFTRKKKARRLDCALFAVCSVQEEIGLRGAITSAYAIEPHVGIAVDVGFATDYPAENKKQVGEFKLGEGPILHRGANINPVAGRHHGVHRRQARYPLPAFRRRRRHGHRCQRHADFPPRRGHGAGVHPQPLHAFAD